jgi:hypothetical protein
MIGYHVGLNGLVIEIICCSMIYPTPDIMLLVAGIWPVHHGIGSPKSCAVAVNNMNKIMR